ncbi:hypothetical protein [Cellulomonas edaphi]|uniref:Uncharacterized protein n=1 Tax=Cellulomonas edaphi TaxID=3053468 RepID=A0ABT7SA59_9CELL|nr:hypothetical protein [Cellulomons edaphi]MDM7832515.1 hypothetical protein [Cellulomons edaphi]
MVWSSLAKTLAWPMAKKSAVRIAAFMAANPKLQASVQQQVTLASRRIAEAQRARTPEEKVSRAMVSVREQAEWVLVHEPSEHDEARARGWLARADKVSQALTLVQHLHRRERQEPLAKVTASADALVAEVLLSLVDDDPPSIEGR